jgi:methionine-rich copper-binding protein CopC
MNRLTLFFLLACALALPLPAQAHATPRHADPGAGASLAQAPAAVTIRFDAELEPLFSSLVVKDAQGVQVSEGKGQVDAHDPRQISARITAARKGVYHVYWRVLSRDGHRTEGDYTFTVR